MKKWVKLLSLILALSIVASIAAGCGKKKEEEEETADETEASFVDLQNGFTSVKVTDGNSAIEAAKSASDSLDMGDTAYDLVLADVSTYDGDTYYRLQQTINGVPVYGREVIVTADSSGNAISLTSNMAKVSEAGGTKDVSGIDYTQVRDKTIALLEDDDHKLSEVKCVTKPETVYYAMDDGTARACFKDVISFKVNDNRTYAVEVLFDCNNYEFVDADLVSTYDGSVFVSGKDVEGVDRTFTAYQKDSTYYLIDDDRSMAILNAQDNVLLVGQIYRDSNDKVYYFNDGKLVDDNGNEYQLNEDETQILDASGTVVGNDVKNELLFSSNPDASALDYAQSTSSTWSDEKAVSAIDRATAAYDYYYNCLGRKGFDDNNSPFYVVYNDLMYGADISNAYSYSARDMTVVSISTNNSIRYELVGHEYTHSVISSIVDLPYRNQPGAINESYADIFGEIIEDYGDDGAFNNSCDWIHGDRNLIDPVSSGYPAEYKGENWFPNIALPQFLANGILSSLDAQIDHGGVHQNSTVLAHAAYLMNNGIDGDAGKQIGTEQLGKIWYRAMFTMHSNESMRELAGSVYEAASRTDGITSAQLECIKEAFAQVNLEI